MQRQRLVDYARGVFAESATRVGCSAFVGETRHSVQRVVVILCAARSGSSFLFEALCRTGQFLALPSEHTPFYKLARLGREDLGLATDRMDAGTSRAVEPAQLDELFGYLALEICSGPAVAAAGRGVLVERMVRRLALQWPRLARPHAELEAICSRALDQQGGLEGTDSVGRAYLDAVRAVTEPHSRDHTDYYDVPARTSSGVPPPPDDAYVIEEPPFVLPKRGICTPPSRSGSAAILLKASIDAYYYPLIEALFPNAEISIIYLHRNPASAINGLADGWSRGTFYSHNVGGERRLDIRGYSEHSPWNRSWWKFELPPGWTDFATQPLESVCARQWLSANELILNALSTHRGPVQRVAYEQLVRDEQSFSTHFGSLLKFLGVTSPRGASIQLQDIPSHMATSAPRFFKWRNREEAIQQQIADPAIAYMAKHLDYDVSSVNREWI